MKKIVIILVALFIMADSSASNVLPTNNLVLVSSSKNTIRLQYKNMEKIKTTVTIFDESGIVLYRSTKKAPSMLPQKFLFDELRGDNFIVVLENDFKKVVSEFQMKDGEAVTLAEEQVAYKPVFVDQDALLRVNMINPNEEEVTIDVLDVQGNKLVETMKSTDVFVKQLIDYHKLQEDAYVSVKTTDNTYGYFLQK